MGCLFALMAGLFPRLALFILWVATLTRIDAAFDTFLLPLLGIMFLPVRDPDGRAALHPRPGPVRMGLVLGRHRRPPRHRALGRRRHPAKPEGTPGQAVSPWSRTPPVTPRMPVPHGQGHRRIRTSVRLASALPDVRQSGSPSSAD